MLGKASEIKCLYVEGFECFTASDCGIPEDAEILDIKFSTVSEGKYVILKSALIIYKESTSSKQAKEFLNKK